MTVILRRLQKNVHGFPSECHGGNFKQTIQNLDLNLYRQLVLDHVLLSYEYDILCSLVAKNKPEELPQETLEEILALAIVLEYIFDFYLNCPREVKRFRGHQNFCLKQLADKSSAIGISINLPPFNSVGVGHTVRTLSARISWPRLFAGRARRFLLALAEAMPHWRLYNQCVNGVDFFVGPLLANLSWFFFAPRLFANLYSLGKHVIPGQWMSPQEKELDWYTRFEAQFSGRWFLLGNDSVWLVAGILACFILTGNLATWAIYFTITFQAYDVLLVALRIYVECQRWQRLVSEHNDLEGNQDFKKYLTHRIHCDMQQLYLMFFNNYMLLLGSCLMVPALSGSPVISVIGASFGISSTIYCYFALEKLQEKKEIKEFPQEWQGSASFFRPAEGSVPCLTQGNLQLLKT